MGAYRVQAEGLQQQREIRECFVVGMGKVQKQVKDHIPGNSELVSRLSKQSGVLPS